MSSPTERAGRAGSPGPFRRGTRSSRGLAGIPPGLGFAIPEHVPDVLVARQGLRGLAVHLGRPVPFALLLVGRGPAVEARGQLVDEVLLDALLAAVGADGGLVDLGRPLPFLLLDEWLGPGVVHVLHQLAGPG